MSQVNRPHAQSLAEGRKDEPQGTGAGGEPPEAAPSADQGGCPNNNLPAFIADLFSGHGTQNAVAKSRPPAPPFNAVTYWPSQPMPTVADAFEWWGSIEKTDPTEIEHIWCKPGKELQNPRILMLMRVARETMQVERLDKNVRVRLLDKLVTLSGKGDTEVLALPVSEAAALLLGRRSNERSAIRDGKTLSDDDAPDVTKVNGEHDENEQARHDQQGDLPSVPMPSAAQASKQKRVTVEDDPTPLPVKPHPVYIVQPPGQPVPVVFSPPTPQNDGTTLRETTGGAASTDTIIALGNRMYQIGDYTPIELFDTEDLVLQAFLGDGRKIQPLASMRLPALRKRSVTHAHKVLKNLTEKYDGRFAPAIDMPVDGKAGNGYAVRIHRANPPSTN